MKRSLIKFKIFDNYPFLIHKVFDKYIGNIDFRFDKRGIVLKNRQKIAKILKINLKNIYEMDQVHGSNIKIIDKSLLQIIKDNQINDSDGLITNLRNIFLLVKVADCFPVLYFDPKKKVVAICHVGWRGAKEKIFVKVLQKMVTNFNSDLSDILIAVGPGIRACCYKHKNLVQQQDNLWQPFIKKGKEGLISIDIPGFILKNLKKAGIRQKNIEISDICTCCSGNFFSHFRSLKTGEPEKRFAAIIGINNEKN